MCYLAGWMARAPGDRMKSGDFDFQTRELPRQFCSHFEADAGIIVEGFG
jgi:hypothetical protein